RVLRDPDLECWRDPSSGHPPGPSCRVLMLHALQEEARRHRACRILFRDVWRTPANPRRRSLCCGPSAPSPTTRGWRHGADLRLMAVNDPWRLNRAPSVEGGSRHGWRTRRVQHREHALSTHERYRRQAGEAFAIPPGGMSVWYSIPADDYLDNRQPEYAL